jgi:hypothetical protein
VSDLGLPVLVSRQESAAFAVCGWCGRRRRVVGRKMSIIGKEKANRAFSTSIARVAEKGESLTHEDD